MNKELRDKLVSIAYGCVHKADIGLNKDGVEKFLSFIDEHFVAKEEVELERKALFKTITEPLYTKEQVLEFIGEDDKPREDDSNSEMHVMIGYNQAKKEIRNKLEHE